MYGRKFKVIYQSIDKKSMFYHIQSGQANSTSLLVKMLVIRWATLKDFLFPAHQNFQKCRVRSFLFYFLFYFYVMAALSR